MCRTSFEAIDHCGNMLCLDIFQLKHWSGHSPTGLSGSPGPAHFLCHLIESIYPTTEKVHEQQRQVKDELVLFL